MKSGDYVMCAKHNTRRIARYCVAVPVYNADHDIIRYDYECKESERCSSAARQGERGADAKAGVREIASLSAPSAVARTVVTAPQGSEGDKQDGPLSGEESAPTVHCDFAKKDDANDETAKAGGALRSPTEQPPAKPKSTLRYYDARAPRPDRPHSPRGEGGEMKKLCWRCGLTGHEKTACLNNLCRMCHRKRAMLSPAFDRNDYDNPLRHVCEQLPPSSFVSLDAELPQSPDGMPACRCVVCGQYGHFDCRSANRVEADKNAAETALSCAWCAVRGHHAFDCRARMRRTTDYWRQRIEHAHGGASRADGSAQDGYGGGGINSNSNQGNGSHPAYDRRDNYKSGGNYNRNSNDRGGGLGQSHARDTGYSPSANQWSGQARRRTENNNTSYASRRDDYRNNNNDNNNYHRTRDSRIQAQEMQRFGQSDRESRGDFSRQPQRALSYRDRGANVNNSGGGGNNRNTRGTAPYAKRSRNDYGSGSSRQRHFDDADEGDLF